MSKAISVILFISVVSILGCGETPFVHPTDENMILVYDQNKGSFDELLHLFLQSKIREIRLNEPINLGPEIHHRYWELMSKLNVHMIHIRGEGESHIEFTVFFSGWATGGENKSYVWSIESKQPLVDNLDSYRINHKDFAAYRKIDNNWYIRMEHDG